MKFFNKGNWLVLFILIMTFATIFITIAVEDIFIKNELDEPGNQSTIIIEIAVGIILAFIVHRKTSEQQTELNNAVTEIRELVNEIKIIEEKQQGILDNQQKSQQIRKKSTMENMKNSIQEALEKITEAEKEWKKDSSRAPHSVIYANDQYHIFWRLFQQNSDFFDIETIGILESYNQIHLDYYPLINENENVESNLKVLASNFGELESIIQKLIINDSKN